MSLPPRSAPRPRITSYRDLFAWQKAIGLCENVYRVCRRLPRSETFGLADQLRRAAVSVASNIAEGHARGQTGEYLRFQAIARGSLAELETQLEIAVKIGYLETFETRPLLDAADELGRMLAGLFKRLRERASRGRKRGP